MVLQCQSALGTVYLMKKRRRVRPSVFRFHIEIRTVFDRRHYHSSLIQISTKPALPGSMVTDMKKGLTMQITEQGFPLADSFEHALMPDQGQIQSIVFSACLYNIWKPAQQKIPPQNPQTSEQFPVPDKIHAVARRNDISIQPVDPAYFCAIFFQLPHGVSLSCILGSYCAPLPVGCDVLVNSSSDRK